MIVAIQGKQLLIRYYVLYLFPYIFLCIGAVLLDMIGMMTEEGLHLLVTMTGEDPTGTTVEVTGMITIEGGEEDRVVTMIVEEALDMIEDKSIYFLAKLLVTCFTFIL